MRPAEHIKRLVKKLNDTTSAEMDQRVLTDVLSALAESEESSAVTRPKKWRTIMKSRIAKLAAAAVIVIAVLISVNQFGGSSTGVVWGEVVQNIEASSGFIFQSKQVYDRETGTLEMNSEIYGSAEYGIRMDSYSDPENRIQMYVNLKEGTLTSIVHSSKTYSRQPLTSDQLAELEKMDPKEGIREMLSAGYRKLGRKMINGIEAEGVEITDPAGADIHSETPVEIDSFVAQLWVAVETGLPVFLESKTSINNGAQISHTIQDEFQWNVDLDASEFEPNIPADYTLMED